MKTEAKDLFFKYCGSHFQMERDGVYGDYLKLGVSDEDERIWETELLGKLLQDFATSRVADDSYISLIRLLRSSLNFEVLEEFISLTERFEEDFDTFTKLRLSESLCELARVFESLSMEAASLAKSRARKLLGRARVESVRVADYYKKLSYLRDRLDSASIAKRIVRLSDKEFDR